jgi:hypothetical protein
MPRKKGPTEKRKKERKGLLMSDSPAYQAAQYVHRAYQQRRIDIAETYSRNCDANGDRLVEELADIALRYDLSPTRVVTYAFGNVRPDFIGRVRRAISALKVNNRVTGGCNGAED